MIMFSRRIVFKMPLFWPYIGYKGCDTRQRLRNGFMTMRALDAIFATLKSIIVVSVAVSVCPLKRRDPNSCPDSTRVPYYLHLQNVAVEIFHDGNVLEMFSKKKMSSETVECYPILCAASCMNPINILVEW